MKYFVVLLVVALAGCATRTAYQPTPLPYQAIENIKLTNNDCQRADSIIGNMEEQLRLKGYAGVNPEDLPSDEARAYNSRAKVVIWSLRIGCNNPDRYK